MNVFSKPLEAIQLDLLETIWRPALDSGRWPTWDYVDREFHRQHGLNAWPVVASLPGTTLQLSRRRYSLVAYVGFDGAEPEKRTEQMALTVGGMAHITAARPLVRGFLTIVGRLVEREKLLASDPAAAADTKVDVRSVVRSVFRQNGGVLGPLVQAIFNWEPPTWTILEGPEPTFDLLPYLREFDGCKEIHTYLDRVETYFGRELIAAPRVLAQPPLTLHATLDHLNTLWLLHTDRLLLRTARTYPIGVLTEPCADRDDFDTHISALCDLLEQISPGVSEANGGQVKGPTWTRQLHAWVTSNLDDDRAGRCAEAIEDLRCVTQLRNAVRHKDAWERSATAFADAGVRYPPSDWAQAWTIVELSTTQALQDLVEALASDVYHRSE